MEFVYKSLQSRTRWLRALLCILAGMDAISLASDLYQRKILQQLVDHSYESRDAIVASATTSDLLQRLISISELGLLLAIYILAGIWIHRAARNTIALGHRELPISPGWSVGWYFIPFANLVKPFQAMDQIWRASAASANWDRRATPMILRLWWGLWLASGFLGQVILRTSISAKETDALLNVNTLQLIANPLSLVLNLIFAYIVVNIGAMQARQGTPPLSPIIVPAAFPDGSAPDHI